MRIHMPGAVAKTKKATNILRPAIDVTFDKDAEFEIRGIFGLWTGEFTNLWIGALWVHLTMNC